MATITLNIPDADESKIIAALCAAGGFTESTEANAEAAIMKWVLRVAESNAATDAYQAAQDALTAAQEAATTDGAEWVRPTGAHDAYPKNREATFDGKTWINDIPNNVYSPGLAGWHEKVAPGELPAWTQPSGAADAWNRPGVGNDKVTHNGQNWITTTVNNVWEPGVFGWEVMP